MNIDLSEKSISMIDVLRKYPYMLIADTVNLASIRGFLSGYVEGINTCFKINLDKKISIWFQKRINKESSLVWDSLICYQCKGETEVEKIVYLLDELENFFIENKFLL